MNGEELLRAMGHVEERYVEEAQAAPTPKRLPWMRIGAMAACFTLVLGLGGFWLTGGGFGMKANSESANRAEEDCFYGAELGVPETVQDIAVEGTDQKFPQPAERPSVLVRIDAWQENGFSATVEGIVDTDIFPVGTSLSVVFEEDIRIVETDGEVVSCTLRIPTAEDFPAGSTVQVMFCIRDGMIFAEQIGTEDAF